ncbi:HPP-domain-containing protein [Nemania sp. NC0429]|nr:HPP-domain-containing protein [Nemania sp. NC0429]
MLFTMHIPSSAKPYVSWVTHWFGFRHDAHAKVHGPPKIYIPYIWAFIGAFSGLAVLQAIFGQSNYFIERGVPPLVASYGASAVLCFGVVESPLAQPRSVVGGHFLSALTGVIYTRIFSIYNLAHADKQGEHLIWLAASLSTATATIVMMLTKTTHPPAGATALLPMLEPAINELGWYFLPVVLLSSSVMVAVALLTNNIQRRYPIFWWSPAPKPVVLPVSQKNELQSQVMDLSAQDSK